MNSEDRSIPSSLPPSLKNSTSTNSNEKTNTTETKTHSKVASGTKRSHEEDPEEYKTSSNTQSENLAPTVHEYKRSAYDIGTSKPYYANESYRQGPGVHEQRPTYTAPFNARHSQEDYSVPNHMVGLLIGKGGENLKKIERISGVTKVQFDNDPIGNERVVHIIGESDQIAIARDMIRQMVSDAQVNDSNRFPSQSVNTTNQTSINFRIPSNKVGLVIGRGGETLRDFQERSKAKIMIASDSYGDRNHERVITLVGDPTSTQQAKTMIEELIFGSSNPPIQNNYVNNIYDPNKYNAAYPFYGYGTAPRADDDNVLIPVPSYAVGLIIGKGGETIRNMQEQSGARVKVNPTNDPSPEQRIVNITGDPHCVAIARRLVEEKVNEANRTANMRHPGYNATSNEHYYNAEYSQYNQYYTQYGFNPQQYYPGSVQAYQQYPNYPYFHQQTGHNESIPKNPSNPQNGYPSSKGDSKMLNAETSANYYSNQFYGGQHFTAEQEAYNQWYQYYNSQQNGDYSSLQRKQGITNDNKRTVSGAQRSQSNNGSAKPNSAKQDKTKNKAPAVQTL